MWSMVCSYHINEPIGQGCPQSCSVFGSLDGGVALDAGAQGGVVAVAEIEVGDGGFGGNVLTLNFEL